MNTADKIKEARDLEFFQLLDSEGREIVNASRIAAGKAPFKKA